MHNAIRCTIQQTQTQSATIRASSQYFTQNMLLPFHKIFYKTMNIKCISKKDL